MQEILTAIGDPRVRVVSHPKNLGLAAARNTGFRAATFDLVLPLDADDCLEPTFLEVTVAALEQHPELDGVFTDFHLFGNQTGILCLTYTSVAELLMERCSIPGSGVVIRKRLWNRVGGYAEAPILRHGSEDTDFWIGSAAGGLEIKHIPDALYWYRRHAASQTATHSSRNQYREREAIYQRHRAILDQFQAGPRFRSNGYLNSSGAFRALGNWRLGVWFAVRALLIDPANPRFLGGPYRFFNVRSRLRATEGA